MLKTAAVEDLKLCLLIAQTIERLEHENFEQGEWRIGWAATRGLWFRARNPGQHGDKDRPIHHGVEGGERVAQALDLCEAVVAIKETGSDRLNVSARCFHAGK
jgi:hypothetical protein